MNLRRTMYKLQTALCQQGRYIKINQYQSYSESAGRMVTKFVLQEKRTVTKPDGKLVRKDVTLFETYQAAEAVKFLAGLLGGD